MFNSRTKIKELLAYEPQGQEATVMGWVRTFRNNQFVALNDGSTNQNLQVVLELGTFDEALLKRITTSAALKVKGHVVASLGKGQKLELKADRIEILGDSDGEKYPLQPKKHSLEFLREMAHLRFRTNTFGAVFRVRHALAFAVHQFFNERGFVYLHTPIITASDAEGAGEMFQVTTLPLRNIPLKNEDLERRASGYFTFIEDSLTNLNLTDFSVENHIDELNTLIKSVDKEKNFKAIVLATPSQIADLSGKKSKYLNIKQDLIHTYEKLKGKLYEKKGDDEYFTSKAASILKVDPAVPIKRRYNKDDDPHLQFSFYNFSQLREQLRNNPQSFINYNEDFFDRAANLTVSGQLEGELGATALGAIYTFGPTFRAENSNTTRHLAEFWMIEPEMAFYDLEDNANLAEEFIQYLIRYAMEQCGDDLEFLRQRLLEEEKAKPQADRSELDLLQKLQFVVDNKFERITYTEAVDILVQSPHYKKKKFQYDVKWGTDLQSEHERYLVEKHFKKPIVVTDYPKEIKAFYMRQNDDGKTVAAMDILAPGIGEIVGGSQREERLDKLETRMAEMHVPAEQLWWYLDTRRFGTVPHAGFGLGFERMVQFVTGMTNIRDVIPFPRTPKSAEF